jgi:hypothetical protein
LLYFDIKEEDNDNRIYKEIHSISKIKSILADNVNQHENFMFELVSYLFASIQSKFYMYQTAVPPSQINILIHFGNLENNIAL